MQRTSLLTCFSLRSTNINSCLCEFTSPHFIWFVYLMFDEAIAPWENSHTHVILYYYRESIFIRKQIIVRNMTQYDSG